MILQTLGELYQRLSKQKGIDIPRFGYTTQPIHYAIVIGNDGTLLQFQDLRNDTYNKKPTPVEIIVPEIRVTPGKPTIETAKPNFLWGNTGYVLGVDDKGKPENSQITFGAFRAFHLELCDRAVDPALQAVVAFLRWWSPRRTNAVPNWDEVLAAKGNLVFRLAGERQFVHQHEEAKHIWGRFKEENVSPTKGHCLVTGKYGSILPTHPKLKERSFGSFGAALVSFNDQAYESYGKQQNFNAPISEESAFAYTTALNYLPPPPPRRQAPMGSVVVAFWTEGESPIENLWGDLFNPTFNDGSRNKELYDYLSAVRDGKKPPKVDTTMKMFFLGLSANAARLVVRLWIVDTVDKFQRHLLSHFENLRLPKRYGSENEFPGFRQLLIETLPSKKELRKPEKLNPLLSASMMRSVLRGERYPESLLMVYVQRLRADGDVSYYRCGMLKAILRRNYDMEVSMGLDEKCVLPAYRLGRLFAVLEKVQIAAIWGERTRLSDIGATIKDRYYGAASATPAIVFPQLLRLAQHHVSKAEFGRRYDFLIEEIVTDFSPNAGGYPKHLDLKNQGLFSLGYYHQRAAFYARSEDSNEETMKEGA